MNSEDPRHTAPSGPSRTRNRHATEEALIAAACTAFAEIGYESTTTKLIAERAGCSEALIQRYFNGKEGLLLAVLRHEDTEYEIEFLRRPLCSNLAEEAREAFTHALDVMAIRSRKLRIVLSRVLIEPSFRSDFNRICIYREKKSEAMMRFMRYRAAGMLSLDLDVESVVEMLMGLSFDISFLHRELLDADTVKQQDLVNQFALMFGRAVSSHGVTRHSVKESSASV
jgi:TetR/AcrR family transcriptional regulator, regulator of cefoperazone and chloramphenicol sensitivity